MKATMKRIFTLALAVVMLCGLATSVWLLNGGNVALAAGESDVIKYVDVAHDSISAGATDENGVTTYTVNSTDGVWWKSAMEGCTDKVGETDASKGELSGYDAYTYYLDTTLRDGDTKPNELSMPLYFYYVADGARKQVNPTSYWYVSDDGEVFHADGTSIMPANFKGNVYALFEDATEFASNIATANYYVTRVLKTGNSGATVRMGNTRMIKNGKEIIEAAIASTEKKEIAVKANQAQSASGNTTYDASTGKVTNKGEDWWKSWITSPYHLVTDTENKYVIDLTGYDAYVFDIAVPEDLGKDSSGNAITTLGLDTVFYTVENGTRKEGRPTALHLIDKNGDPVEFATDGYMIPAGFEGSVYILLEEVTRVPTTGGITGAFGDAENLAKASVVVNRVVTTKAYVDGSAVSVSFTMSNMKFITNGKTIIESGKGILDDFQNTFLMTPGAAIRMVKNADGNYGIKYQVTYGKAEYEALVTYLNAESTEFGIIFTLKGGTARYVPIDPENIQVKEDGTACFEIMLDVAPENVGKKITGQGYLKVNGAEYTSYFYETGYSVADIARKALDRTDSRYSEDHKKMLRVIVDLANSSST